MPAPLILASIMTAMAFIAFPANAQIAVGEEHCVVNVRPDDALNMRSAGSASSRVVSKLRYGRCGVMVVANCKGQWCPIEDGHNGGWVNRRFISMVSPAMYCVDGISGQKRFPSAPIHPITRASSKSSCRTSAKSSSCPTRHMDGRRSGYRGTKAGCSLGICPDSEEPPASI